MFAANGGSKVPLERSHLVSVLLVLWDKDVIPAFDMALEESQALF